jgi:hypothetical protein
VFVPGVTRYPRAVGENDAVANRRAKEVNEMPEKKVTPKAPAAKKSSAKKTPATRVTKQVKHRKVATRKVAGPR